MVDSGQSLSHYKIIRPLGKGGMGEVFLAEDTVLGRKVALKFLAKDAIEDTTARSRFLREAKSAAAIDDPFICKIYETGEVDGEPFIAMEYIEGESLADRIDRAPMSVEEAVTIASEIAEALGAAHEHGIIHRDLKPSNIMLTAQGHAKVLDFGLAKQVFIPGDMDTSAETATSDNLTGRGVTLGTLTYMSPEQLRGLALTPKSDVFSFGIVLHEMLTGKHPFSRPSSPETMSAIMAEPPPTPEHYEGKIPQKLLDVHDKALAKEPEDRYPNAMEIVGDLEEIRQAIAPAKKATHTIGIAMAIVLAAIVVVAGLRLLPRGVEAPMTPEAMSVLVADFDNQTGEEVFTGVLEKATSIVLEDASFVSTYGRDAALRAAEAIRPGATVLDEELARLIAHREGVNIVVSGSISKSDGSYVVSMSAIDAIEGNVVSEQEIDVGGREEVLNAAGRLAGRTREELGDTDSVAIRHAAEETFTASSLDAARAYVQAQEKMSAGKWQEAIDAFLLLAEDYPEMGRAYAGAAVALANMNRREEAAEYFELAMSHIEHMSEREKFRTRGTYYLMTRNYPKASEVYEQLVEAYPHDEVARVNLVLGYFYGRQMDRALIAAQDAVEKFPESVIALANLGLIAMYAGDFETAKSQIAILFQAHPSYETAYVGLALSQQALGETEEATQTYRTLADISRFGASLAASGLADLALAGGRYGDAVEILENAAAVDIANGDEAAAGRKFTALAHAQLMGGQSNAAVATADRAVETSQQDPVLFEAARVHVEAGSFSRASDLASQLGGRLAPEPRAYAKLIEGEIALANEEASQAVSLFNEAQAILDTWLGRVDLGRAYLESGAFLEAHAEFEAALRRQGEAASVFLDDLPTIHYLPPLHYWLGRALEGLGSPAAADSYRTFLAIKANADEDALVADARRRSQNSPEV
jgi:tetratricopeptide (TPR) repeat protein/tRNA A-37 threonylcarbamoyl transferase component Bud32